MRLEFNDSLASLSILEMNRRSPKPAGQESQPSAAPTDTKDLASQPLTETITRTLQESMQETERRQPKLLDKQMQTLAAVEGVSVPEFDAAWKIDLEIDQQPACGVLERLAADLGLRVANAAEHAEVLNTSVSVQMRGISRLQTMEWLCSQIGLYPDYQRQPVLLDGGPFGAMAQALGALAGQQVQRTEPKPDEDALPAVTLRPGARPIPLAFVGPFAVEVTQIQEFPPDATGRMELCLFAGGVPASVLTHWDQNRWSGGSAFRKPTLSFGKWQELGGRDVLTPDQGECTAPSSAVLPGRTTQLELRNLLRDVQTIRLANDVTAALP